MEKNNWNEEGNDAGLERVKKGRYAFFMEVNSSSRFSIDSQR
jgi:hypothetical protein